MLQTTLRRSDPLLTRVAIQVTFIGNRIFVGIPIVHSIIVIGLVGGKAPAVVVEIVVPW